MVGHPALVVDRHELVHGGTNRHVVAHAGTPAVANEGWAERHAFAPGTRPLDASRAHAPLVRNRGRDLGRPAWYHHCGGPVYEEGHLWVDFPPRL